MKKLIRFLVSFGLMLFGFGFVYAIFAFSNISPYISDWSSDARMFFGMVAFLVAGVSFIIGITVDEIHK